MNLDKNTAERTDEARSRISTMLALATVLETPIGPEEIREAALVPLSPAAERFVVWALNYVQMNVWAATLVLAGQGPDAIITEIMSAVDGAAKMTPARRPRRPRPTAADRRAAADRWLAGPAWDIVDPDLNSYPTEGAP